MSKLVEVHFLDVVTRGESAMLALRWEATGPGGRLFPALDADISLIPAGEHSTRLSLAAVYRPPLAALGTGLDQAIFRTVADATVRSLLARVADVLARPQEPTGAGQGTDMTRNAARGGQGRNALSWLPSGERTRLMVIEHDVPDVPDRQVQLADGFLDLPGSRMVTISAGAVSRDSPAENSRYTARSFMPAAMRSRSCTRSSDASAQSHTLPGGRSRVGRMLASSSSGIARSRAARSIDMGILGTSLTGRGWPCRQGTGRRR